MNDIKHTPTLKDFKKAKCFGDLLTAAYFTLPGTDRPYRAHRTNDWGECVIIQDGECAGYISQLENSELIIKRKVLGIMFTYHAKFKMINCFGSKPQTER